VDNTPTSPVSIPKESLVTASTLCPAVTKNFVNGPTCVRRQACAAVQYSSVNFPLNNTMVRSFYTVGYKYVYYVDGLRLEDAYDDSPCSGTSRWLKHEAACDAVWGMTTGTNGETPLDDATVATLTDALTGSNGNSGPSFTWPHVRDIVMDASDGECTSQLNGVSATGAMINIDGVCFEHVHPDTVRARPGRLSTLSVSHSKSFFYGAFAWARRALNSPKRRFPARAVQRV
jgi:hypothetical protein